MSLLTNLKLNYITKLLQDVENTTANQDVLNAVIKYMNENPDKFDPTIDMSKLNQFVQDYVNKNSSVFQGIPGPPSSTSEITDALSVYFKTSTAVNFLNATFSVIITKNNYLKCGNTTLQNYNTLNNTSSQNDIQTNYIKVNGITCSNIYGTDGVVSTGVVQTNCIDLLNCFNGKTTNGLTCTDVLTVPKSSNLTGAITFQKTLK